MKYIIFIIMLFVMIGCTSDRYAIKTLKVGGKFNPNDKNYELAMVSIDSLSAIYNIFTSTKGGTYYTYIIEMRMSDSVITHIERK